MNRIRTLLASTYQHARRRPRTSIAGIALLCAVVLFFVLSPADTAEAPTDSVTTPLVSTASVAALSSDSEPLILLGEVRSVSQAELRVQKPGKVTGVYVRAGQYVPAGAILAEIDNAAERASVVSAQGGLAAAQAQLDRVRAGDRGEDKASSVAQTQSAVVALQGARDNARTAYSQSYTIAQDAVFAQADDFFTNAYTVNPSFRVNSASYDESNAIEKERVAIGTLLDTWKKNTQTTIPDTQLATRLTEAERDLDRIKNFLNTVSTFVSEQELTGDLTSAQKAAQEGVVLGARTNVDGARNTVTGARTGLAGALSAAQVASLNESKSVTGARPEDIRSAEAAVTQARGGLLSAQAALENSIIRTPIAGTVSTLNIARGDFVSGSEVAAVVANEGALEIEVFVSDTVRERVTVGQKVLVAGLYEGTVTSAAPGLDPVTKKARVTIGLSKDAPLTNGAYVETALVDTTTPTVASTTEFHIPLSAIKVLPTGLAVFTVRTDNTLEAHPVAEGTIVGDRMILRDLTPDLTIVTDVRGLKEGELVEIAREQ